MKLPKSDRGPFTVYTFPDATYRGGGDEHRVTHILRKNGYSVQQSQDGPLDPNNDIIWILGNPTWHPNLFHHLNNLPKQSRSFVVVWHYELLPPSKISGRRWPLLHSREVIRILLRRKRLTNAYSNFLGLRSLYAKGLIDLLIVSMEGRTLMLRERGMDAIHVPLGYAPSFGRDLSIQRDIDVVFLGDLIPGLETRRRKLIHRLRRDGVDIEVVGSYENDAYWGESRTRFLNRTKILLNLHRFPGDLAGLRLMLGMANKALVISEPADFPAPYIPDVHFVSAEIEEIPERIEYYLANDEARKDIVESGHRFVTEDLTMEQSVTSILNLCEARRSAS